MPMGWLPAATGNSVIAPAGVILPMKFAMLSVNHRLPSGPLTIWFGRRAPGTGNSVSVPPVLMRPMARRSISVNHKLPSGPVTIPRGLAAGPGGIRKSVSKVYTCCVNGVESLGAKFESPK